MCLSLAGIAGIRRGGHHSEEAWYPAAVEAEHQDLATRPARQVFGVDDEFPDDESRVAENTGKLTQELVPGTSADTSLDSKFPGLDSVVISWPASVTAAH
jgi:hypothetical protein